MARSIEPQGPQVAIRLGGRRLRPAYRIAESRYRLNISRMFAALILLAAGLVIFFTLSALSYLLLPH